MRCSSARRATVLRQVLALFVSERPQTTYDLNALDEVLVSLSRPAESSELVELTDSIARSGLHLPKLTQQLALHRSAAIAGPILRTSNSISERTLLAIAKTRGQDHLLAISWRPAISDKLTSVLVLRGNVAVLRNVSRNHGAKLSDRSFSVLLKLAERDEELSEALAGRSDIPAASIRKLLTLVTGGPRERFVATASPETRAVASELVEVRDRVKPEVPNIDYSGAAAAVRTLSRTGKLSDASVNRFAVAGEHEMLVAALALLAEADIKEIVKVVYEEPADAVAVACKAARLRWATAASNLVNRPCQPPISRTELEAARELFDQVSLSEAQRSIRFASADRKLAASRAF